MAEPDPHRSSRHARKRRLKRLLRYAPRRAVFHRYPFFGRFAAFARKRAYLWSFKPGHVRPALYLGAVLAFWPVMGLQLLLVFVGSIFTRSNLMIAGALQFISNPLTAAPLYFGTYHIGRFVLIRTGMRGGPAPSTAPSAEAITISITPDEVLPRSVDWTSSFGSTVMALFIGGTLCGLALAVVLDLLYTAIWKMEHRKVRESPAPHVDSDI